MIDLHHISKRFGALQALDDVSLRIVPGRVLGLLGENGAGKSTLMHILFGMQRAEGEIRVNGHPARLKSPRDAQRLGIGMVHQHFKLVPTLSGRDNLRLFVRRGAGEVKEEAEKLLAQLRWSVPLDRPVEALTVGEQQRIEIVKALLSVQSSQASSVVDGDDRLKAGLRTTLILDEPTAVLTPQETGELFVALRSLRDAGAAIVFISHKLSEVRQICDDIAILRRGKLVHMGPTSELSPEAMAKKMVGTRVEMPHLKQTDANAQRPPSATVRAEKLSLRHLNTSQLKSLSLQIHAGEILGIAGVDGNGQAHLAQTILGILPPTSGDILIHTCPAAPTTRERLRDIAFIAEDRQKEALVLPLSIQNNLMLKEYRAPRFNTLGWLRFSAWRKQAGELMQLFDIRASSPSLPAAQLSGGNQQKVVLARELHATDRSIVLAVNPTRGLDVGATAFVMQKLLDARARGAAVLLIHSDLDELLAVSDRVAVMFNGRLTQTSWPQTTKEAIGRLMLGVAEAAA